MLVSFVCLRFNWLFQISILLFFFFSLLFYISHFFSLCRVCYLLFLLYISSDSFNGLLPVESVINNNNNNNNNFEVKRRKNYRIPGSKTLTFL
jgi:hypothetical protein